MRERREERGGIGMGCLRLIDMNNRKIKEKIFPNLIFI
jgi:hypothetical protein